MNNLHRELAPISAIAWTDLEEEAKRTFAEFAAARRVVDVVVTGDPALAAVGTGRRERVGGKFDGVATSLRTAQRIVELRVPFTVSRSCSATTSSPPRTRRPTTVIRCWNT